MKIMRAFIATLAVAGALSARAAGPSLLLETESFSDLGGWKLDTQFVDLMGSPYLLAHGLGVPVANAKTVADLPEPGTYHVWVRTKNWVPGAWEAPGRFRVLVDGRPLDPVFGTNAAAWGWQPGGSITAAAARVAVELQDLTGFDGRCDALCFARDADFVPDNSPEPMSAWRRAQAGVRQVPDEKTHDLVVIGGGLAGTAASVAAARLGLDVVLVQNRPVLGGNGSQEIRVAPRGNFPAGRYPHLGDIVREISPHLSENVMDEKTHAAADATRLKVVQAETNLLLLLNHQAYRVEMKGPHIAAVWAFDTRGGSFRRLAARYVVDATGHGTIGLKAGADLRVQEADHMGMSNLWRWRHQREPVAFPATPWALPLTEAGFPYPNGGKADWFWESGFNRHPLNDLEDIRDWNLRAVFGAWNAIKNGGAYAARDPARLSHARAQLEWVAYIGGNRETLQLLGDLVVSQSDIVTNRVFPDSCVPATWGIDVHYAHPVYAQAFPDNPFISRAHFGGRVDDSTGTLARSSSFGVKGPYDQAYDKQHGYLFPYRSFYSRNIDNLFMAGRDISVSHEALGTVRVMQTLGMVGVVVGRATAVAKEQGGTPRDVYEKHWDKLDALLMEPGAYRR